MSVCWSNKAKARTDFFFHVLMCARARACRANKARRSAGCGRSNRNQRLGRQGIYYKLSCIRDV